MRIRGKAYIKKKLTLGQCVKFLIEGDVMREEAEVNQDGLVNICYIIHPISAEDLGDKEHLPSIEPLPVFSQEELDDILAIRSLWTRRTSLFNEANCSSQ